MTTNYAKLRAASNLFWENVVSTEKGSEIIVLAKVNWSLADAGAAAAAVGPRNLVELVGTVAAAAAAAAVVAAAAAAAVFQR